MSGMSFFEALSCPLAMSALPKALLSAKLSLQPNVTNRIFILYLCDLAAKVQQFWDISKYS